MTMLWDNSLEIGIKSIDDQHRELFRRLGNLAQDGGRMDRVGGTLDFLGWYVTTHFSDEETLHAESRYPGAREHREVHLSFVKKYEELRRQYVDSGMNVSLLLKLNRMLVSWLHEHISGHDRHFANYYNEFDWQDRKSAGTRKATGFSNS